MHLSFDLRTKNQFEIQSAKLSAQTLNATEHKIVLYWSTKKWNNWY